MASVHPNQKFALNFKPLHSALLQNSQVCKIHNYLTFSNITSMRKHKKSQVPQKKAGRKWVLQLVLAEAGAVAGATLGK